jgi:hypothetical protein
MQMAIPQWFDRIKRASERMHRDSNVSRRKFAFHATVLQASRRVVDGETSASKGAREAETNFHETSCAFSLPEARAARSFCFSGEARPLLRSITRSGSTAAPENPSSKFMTAFAEPSGSNFFEALRGFYQFM